MSISSSISFATNISGTITSSGDQTYSDAVTLTGDATLNSSDNSNFTFNSTIDGAYSLGINTGGSTIFNGAVTGLTDLNIQSGSFTTNSISITGDLSVTTSGGAITQNGVFVIGGVSNFNAGNGAITLTNANNDFFGTVNLSGNGISVADKNGLSIGTLANAAKSAVTLVAGGVLGLPTTDIDTGTANLTLASNGGSLGLAGSLTGANIALTGRTGITLPNDITTSGTLNLSSTNGPISQPSGIITANTLTGSSSGNTTLTGLNIISTLGDFSANNFSLNDSTALAITGNVSASNISLEDSSGITLTGSLNASGATTLAAGTSLTINDGAASTPIIGNIINNTALNVNRSSDFSFGDTISGSGTLTKNNSGKLTLTGANTYSGPTTINGGTLAVNGSLTSNVTVKNGATLAGTGTVADVLLNSGGIYAPGNSIGTSTAANVDFSGGGIYKVEVDAAGNSDLINVTGTARLSGGLVSVLPQPGSYAQRTDYTILKAGTLDGTFDSVNVDDLNFAFLDASLIYNVNQVLLSLQRNDTNFNTVAQTANQQQVGKTLTTIAQHNAASLQPLFDSLTVLTPQQARNAYDSLSGVQYTATPTLVFGNNLRFSSLLNNRTGALAAGNVVTAFSAGNSPMLQLAYNGNLNDLSSLYDASASLTKESGLWLTPQYGKGEIDSTHNARGTDYHYSGLAGGLDHWVTDRLLIGAALSYGNTTADDLDMKGADLALYGRWLFSGQRYISATTTFGRYHTDSARTIAIGPSATRAKGDYAIDSRSLSLEAGKIFNATNTLQLTPFAGLQYNYARRDSFSEKGSSTGNLAVDADRQESIRSRLGVRVAKSFVTSKGSEWIADARAAWVHEFAEDTASLRAAFAAAPASQFTIAGPELNRDRAEIGAGIASQLSESANVRIGYEAEIASSDRYHTAFASFRYNF